MADDLSTQVQKKASIFQHLKVSKEDLLEYL